MSVVSVILNQWRALSALALVAVATAVCVDSGLAQEKSPDVLMSLNAKRFFEQYCYDCHDADAAEADVDLQSLPLTIAEGIQIAETWDKVLATINAGEMPPEDAQQPTDEHKAVFLRELSRKMVNARKRLGDTGGRQTIRRLNRREYANTMQSLIGVRPDVKDLNSDDESGDFDTSGASLFFSSDQLSVYQDIAKETLRLALTAKAPKKVYSKIEVENRASEFNNEQIARYRNERENATAYFEQKSRLGEQAQSPLAFDLVDEAYAKKMLRISEEYLPSLVRYQQRLLNQTGATLAWMPGQMYRAEGHQFQTYMGGTYRARIRTGAYSDAPPQYRYLKASLQRYNKTKLLGNVRVTGTVDQPEIVELEFELPRNYRPSTFYVEQRTYGDRFVYFNTHYFDNKIGPAPYLWVDWIEIEGPINTFVTPTIQRQMAELLDTQKQPDRELATSKFTEFAASACRGQIPSQDFISALVDRFMSRIEDPDRITALIDPLSILLASPSFLYLAEPHGETRNRINDRELATRLAYFLWSAPPDEELLKLAAGGSLSSDNELARQTERLTRDPRFMAFVEGFVHQWLDMNRLDTFQFPGEYNPYFDEAVRASARREVYETFATCFRENLPPESLLDLDFVVVDDQLIDYYELPFVAGAGFRKVKLPHGSPRGGLLGMAAIHMMGSDGLHSSPVERGVWVLRHILNDPPPPAPANVPMRVKPGHEDLFRARDIQNLHATDPQCIQCHQSIDPIGFGLENFNASGSWRTAEQVMLRPKGDTRKNENPYQPVWAKYTVDPAGKLPNGKSFSDFAGLKRLLAEQGKSFRSGFVETLIAYGLGRPYSLTDDELRDQILAAGEEDNHRIARYLLALIQSKQFHSK